MSTIMMNAVWPLNMPSKAKSVFVSLADNANDNGYCWPAIATISVRTCLSKSTVIRAIKWLEENKCLTADRTNGRHTSYILTPRLYVEPVSDCNRCQDDTGATQTPTGVTVTPVPVSGRHQPVSGCDTNHQEPPIEPPVTTKKKRAAPVGSADHPEDAALPDYVNRDVWLEFVKMRRKIKKPLTDFAAKLIVQELVKQNDAGHDANQCLLSSIRNDWQDVYPPRESSPRQSQRTAVRNGINEQKFETSEVPNNWGDPAHG